MFTKNKTIRFTKKYENLQALLMLLPLLVGFMVFTAYPIIWVLRLAWYEFDGFSSRFIGFENFIRLFTRDPYYWSALLNTAIIAFPEIIIEIPLALILAVLINSKLSGMAIFRTAFYLPSVLSAAVIGLVFHFIFSSYGGVMNNILINLGIINESVNWFGGKWTAIFGIIVTSIWLYFGLDMIFFLTGLQTIPVELYECSEIDGANAFHKFFKITLPLIAPIFQIILMLAILGSLKMTDLVLVLTNGQPGGQTEVVMTYIFKHFFKYGTGSTIPDFGYASALGFVTAIFLGIITVIYLKITRNMNRQV